ncbi:hypothetical protein [Dyadobacter sp. 676]|uniref:FecR protein domain-containing protein n=1 Tax=Dyadobacter sp. 676 TaxID=3088362 RepID=A0AAU8FI28_9BACT
MKLLLLASYLFLPLMAPNARVNVAPLTGSCMTGPERSAYLFPGFVKGTVCFRNGTRRDALMNYHFTEGRMQFLNQRADTMLFTGKYLIDHVEIAGRGFLLTDAHLDMEVVATSGRVRLAARTRSEIVGNKLSHSGQRFSASAGSVPSGLMVSNQGGHFLWENNSAGHLQSLKTSFFLVDQNGTVRPASRRAFMNVYARHKRRLSRYLREYHVDFGDAADLQKLLVFCGELTAFQQ